MAQQPLFLTPLKYLAYLAPGVAARFARHLFRSPKIAPSKPWESFVEEQAERGYLSNGISYLQWRPQHVSLRVLAIHGWEGRATQFGPLAEVLKSNAIETVALDGPGHGKSPGKFADPVLFARELLLAEKELGPFDVVMGHSMGAGSAAIAIYRGLAVKKLVYIAGPAAFKEVVERFAVFFGLPPRAQRAFVRQIERVNGAFEDNDVINILARMQIPTLIIHDREDDDVPLDDAQRLERAIPTARLLITEGLGHKRVLREPAVMEEVLAFITVAS